MIEIALWRTNCGRRFVRLVKTDGRYTLDTSLGPRYLDSHTFDCDADAIRYVQNKVMEGVFDPPTLVWRII